MPRNYTKPHNAKAIKEVRQRLGLKPSALAHALGCTEATIRNYERGRNLPSGQYIDLLHRLCRVRGVNPPEFYDTFYRSILL